MREKDTKKLLIVTTSFFPENAIGAVRISNLAKYLSREFESVHVICPQINDASFKDLTISLDSTDNLFIYRTEYSFLFRQIKYLRDMFVGNRNPAEFIGIKPKKKSIMQSLKQHISKFIFNQFVILKNEDFLASSIKNYKKLTKSFEFDYLLTSYPSYASHKAGLRIKKISKNIKWIADFRDPMIYESIDHFKFFKKLQRNILHNADTILSISNGVKLALIRDNPSAEVEVIHNGYDDPPLLKKTNAIEDRYINFCYVGTLYGGKRDLSRLFIVLNEFLLKHKASKDKLRFHYAGSDFDTLFSQAQMFGIEEILINHGKVTRAESLNIQATCDFITVATWNSRFEQGILTGKVFEAFMLKKPLIGIVTGDLENSELKSIVHECDAGIVLEDSFCNDVDKERILSSLYETLRIKENPTSKIHASIFKYNVDLFHYKNICKKLVNKI